TLTLIYDAGAGAYSVEHGVSTEEAREMIHREFGIVSVLFSNNHWRADRSVKQMHDEQQKVQFQVLSRYPRSLLIATVGGFGRAALSHNVDWYAGMTGRTWNPPGWEALKRGQVGEFLSRLGDNHPILVGMFVYEVVFILLLLLAAGFGLVVGLRRREWRGLVLCLLLVMGYYGV